MPGRLTAVYAVETGTTDGKPIIRKTEKVNHFFTASMLSAAHPDPPRPVYHDTGRDVAADPDNQTRESHNFADLRKCGIMFV